jgi:bifunctional N-acetylglucosamine-1-phosphate-uridyltransferase/glucosamine-1-phosphate-acetyltransferase GlmU-like protein
MTLDPSLLMTILLIAAFGFIGLVFSPLIIELRKPKDKGPRKIPRMPLDRRLRTSGPPTSTSLNEKEPTGHSENLQEALKEAGVKSTRMGKDTVRILGDFVFPPRSEVHDNVVVEGDVKIGDHCVFHQSIKAKGNMSVGNRVVIKGNLVSNGDVKLLDEVVIGGSVHSDGSVTLGEKVFVSMSVVACGNVELYENSEVKNNILTRGTIKMIKPPRIDLPSSIDEIG